MAWIKTIAYEDAKGFLKKQYDEALERAGRIWNVVRLMSLNPRAMKASMNFYGALLIGASPLSRGQREMLAVVVSAANHCVY